MADVVPDLKILQARIQEQIFLIADQSSSRKSLRSLLSEWKVKSDRMLVVESLGDARDMVTTRKPTVILADQGLLGTATSELLELQDKGLSPQTPRAFFLLTTRDSQAIASNAAEESVDAVFIKPFTMEGLRTGILKVLQEKLDPTPLQKLIAQGKGLLREGKNEDALRVFREAKAKDPKFALAVAYEGDALVQLGKAAEARQAYEAGLVLNATHYRSQMGLLDLLVQDKDYVRAYEIARKVAESHTVPLKKLPDFIRLSVVNRKFEDVLGFYHFADAIGEQDASISTYLAAGLVVCGLYFQQNQNPTSAVDAFRKAEVAARGSPNILKRILVALVSVGNQTELKSFLARVPDEVKNAPEIRLAELDFLLTQSDTGGALKLAMELIQQKTKDQKPFLVAIDLSMKIGRKPSTIRDLITQAELAHPGLKEELAAISAKLPVDEPEGNTKKSKSK